MLRNSKRLIVHLLILILLSLVPFLWLRGGQVIIGHDAGFPLSPWEHFLDRLFVWSHRFGLGNDQTTEVGGFFIHGFEAIIDKLGFSLTHVQLITFSTYFFGFGVAMYILARELFPNREKYLPLFASILYMFNHFILQAWFIVERTKFTLYVALPLIISLMIRVVNKKTQPPIAGILGGLVLFVLNGGGFFPLYGALIITYPFIFISSIIFAEKTQRKTIFFDLLVFTCVLILSAVMLSSFWILPFFRFLFTSFSTEVGAAGGVTGVLAWVTSISENSSFYNLFRLQGVPEWYANAYHPYAQTFLNNLFLKFISYSIMVCAFIGYLFAKGKEKKIVVGLIGLALFSMIFVEGSHPPFGFIYVWLIKHIPGFVAFRTPFYKFAPVLWLSYSLLISYTISTLLFKIKKKEAQHIAVVIILIIIGLYNYPFFKGNFFDYEVGRKTTRVSVPQYVFDYADWANSKEFPYQRLLLLPGQNPDTRFEAYTWGYWSLAQIQGLLNNRSYIGNSLYKSSTEEVFIKNLYNLMEQDDPSWVEQAEYLFVDAVLLRKDFNYKLENSPTINPLKLEKFLDKDPRFKKVREFGKWSVYELQNKHVSFAIKDYYYEIQTQDKEKFFEATGLPGIEFDNRTIFLEKNLENLENRRKGIVYIPWCVHCLLENRRIYEISHNQIVTAGSLFYEAQLENDASELARIKKTDKKLTKSTELSLKRIYQLQNQFFREAKVEERVIGLKELLKSLETENLLLDKYLRSNKKYSFDENAFLEVIYENIEQMFAELQIPMQEINEEKEAALYFEIQNLLTKIESKITAHLWYSKDNISKRYFLEVSEPGRYELFIKKPTSNGFSDVKVDTNEIKVKNNNITYPVNIITSKTSQWAKLSEIDLIQGTNKIEVNEPIARSYLGENGNYELSFGPNRNCNELPLPYLDRNTYILNLKAHSDFNLEDLYVFSDMKGTNFPLLPYRGTKFNLEGEKTSYLLIHKLVLIPGDYTLKLCRLTHEEIKPQNIKLSSMYIERISVPVIALFKKNTDTLDPPTTLNVSSKDINNTQYEVSISGSGSSLLMFDQRYDAGWNFSANDIVSDHQRLHGYANGWKVNKKSNGETHLTLTFAGQKLLVIGWFVSLISLIGCIGLLFYYFLKKK